MSRSSKYSPEPRARLARMQLEQHREQSSQWAALGVSAASRATKFSGLVSRLFTRVTDYAKREVVRKAWPPYCFSARVSNACLAPFLILVVKMPYYG